VELLIPRKTGISRSVVWNIDGPQGERFDRWSQPMPHYLRWWVYHHMWEKATWRIWRRLERRVPGREVPFTNAQDLRCYRYEEAGRVYTRGRLIPGGGNGR
jgi:hypothetical protein